VTFSVQLDVVPDAVIGGPNQEYRYVLRRTWNKNLPIVCFVMMNPSDADANLDDPTIRKCIMYARVWGYGGIVVVNLFAYRSSSPTDVQRFQGDPVGPLNDSYIQRAVFEAAIVVCAWGANGAYRNRGKRVLEQIREYLSLNWEVPRCIRMTKSGFPEHPLYLPSNLVPVEIP
jgi:hypothetical protein